MREAEEKIAELPDLKPEDFERVCEFAYTGTFTEPKARLLDEQRFDTGVRLVRMHGMETQKKNLLLSFLRDPSYTNPSDAELRELLESKRAKLIGQVEVDPSKEDHGREDVFNVLMDYARLYMFTEKYMIYALQERVLESLRKYLVELDIFDFTLNAIIKLVPYIYDNNDIADATDEEEIDPLRETIVRFVVLHLDLLIGFAEHRQLLREGGDYPVDLQDTISEWLL
jgi:hypothetical protein